MNQVTQQVEQIFANHKPTIQPERRTVLRPAAVAFSRKPIMRAHAVNMRDVLSKAIESAYEETPDGAYWNLGIGGKLEPVPWGKKGYQRWQVKRIYAECLRRALMNSQAKDSLFLYDSRGRSWYVNLDLYPSVEHARQWLNQFDLQPETVMAMIDGFNAGEVARKLGATVAAGVTGRRRRGSRNGARRGSQA